MIDKPNPPEDVVIEPKVDDKKKKVDPQKPIDPILVPLPPPVVECKMGQIQIDQYKSMNEDLLFNLELLTN